MEITKEKYQNIIDMLCSPDKDNANVALSIIDEIDFEDNIVKIFLMKKHSTAPNALWEEHAPNTFAKLKEVKSLDISKHLTYKDILRLLTVIKAPPESFIFYMNDFRDYLLTQIRHMGYDYIESMEITVKYKEVKDEQSSGELRESV